MEEQIKQKLQEVIDANLPQQMGESFKRYFNEAESIKRELENSKATLKSRDEIIASQKATIDTLTQLNLKKNDLEARDIAISKREKDMDLFELKLKLTESEKRADSVHNLVSQLTKNVIFRQTVFENDHIMSHYQPNGTTSHYKTGSTSTIQTEEDNK